LNESNRIGTHYAKESKFKKYIPTIARLLEVILSMSEEQQKTILKQADDLFGDLATSKPRCGPDARKEYSQTAQLRILVVNSLQFMQKHFRR